MSLVAKTSSGASPAPTAQPNPQNGTATKIVAGLPTVPTGGSTDNSPDYGLGSFAGATFDTSGLGLGQGQMTGIDILNAFAQAGSGGNPTIAGEIQQALLASGFYTDDKYSPQTGVVRKQDMQALANALTVLGRANMNRGGQNQPPALGLTSYLMQQSQLGAQSGILAAQNATAKQAQVAEVALPNQIDLEAAAASAFQKAIGRKATPQEAAAFAREFRDYARANGLANNQTRFNAQQTPQVTVNQPAATVADAETALQNSDFGSDQTNQDISNLLNNYGTFAGQQQDLAGNIKAATASLEPTLTNVVTNGDLTDASAVAENYARNTHPQEAAANDVANTFTNFLSLIGAHFGGQ